LRDSKLYRKVCEIHHGPIPQDWVVHHIDCNELNNNPENLIAMPRQDHTKLHVLMSRHNKILSRKQIEQYLETLNL